ncbi:carboxymuconolactone decarboxylase family protein [uncultured Castellaniella sp.]|uniref:carboxymuconolactone decarboxylase family protein n=1 Tax=uncultured Castellaniella sp. TaxID=647907 RepID=UPI00260DDA48|nr:carboxymuconolactone decarboxylase family protein [uncultured Castellaniella sp.]
MANESEQIPGPSGTEPKQQTLYEQYLEKGEWNPLWDKLRQAAPEFVDAYLAFREVPRVHGPIPKKYVELIMVAINAATTHLYRDGIRRHVQNAFRAGASVEEVLEVIQLISVMGIHSCNVAMPILLEEAAKEGLIDDAG